MAANLTIAELAKLGAEELVGMALAGKIRPRHLWVAAEGAAEYRDAVAAGDIASEADQQARGRKCSACPKATWTDAAAPGVRKAWCGPRLDRDRGAGTCGCLVGLSVNGVFHPGARAAVASLDCWSGEWGPVPPGP